MALGAYKTFKPKFTKEIDMSLLLQGRCPIVSIDIEFQFGLLGDEACCALQLVHTCHLP